jgi:hypothetical protein
MALFDPELPCPLFGRPFAAVDRTIAFTFLGSYDAIIEPLDDALVHQGCLNRWSDRDAFVAAWNAAANGILGEGHLLEVTSAGEVRYKVAHQEVRERDVDDERRTIPERLG